MVEGPLVRVEELAERLTHTGLVETAPRVAEGQDEDVEDDGPAPEVDLGLTPGDLALLAGRGLEAHRGPLGRLLGGAQGADEALHRLLPR